MRMNQSETRNKTQKTSWMNSIFKIGTASLFVYSGIETVSRISPSNLQYSSERRRLQENISKKDKSFLPSFMNGLMEELAARKKLFDDTPPNEVKYWFEYTGALQKYYYRFSKSRGKPDYFEGRDDSGVISARFVKEKGGGSDFTTFFKGSEPSEEIYRRRFLDNCFAMGSSNKATTSKGTFWYDWFGTTSEDEGKVLDRCRALFVMNTVGAGRGTTMLWETPPPALYQKGPEPWMSEQETAAMHIERSLEEIDAMCASGLVAARLQVLVCEPIPAVWTDWMDSKLVHCGGKAPPIETKAKNEEEEVEDRPSPVQVVVVASAQTADICHDLKSGFMEQRIQDLVLAPPYLNSKTVSSDWKPTEKLTHEDLVSTDDHDVYIALKWSSLVTLRALSAFLQASADLTVANNENSQPDANLPSTLIPSFVRVSYVSEENNKVAKWRMHGDFFHPAAWEISKESFETTWIPYSLSSTGGTNLFCNDENCGQYWVYMKEEQMPTNPEIFANEVTPPLVRGGSNFIWMLTEAQRLEMVSQKVCEFKKEKNCAKDAHAVIPIGDLESFLINFMPNTALGKKHEKNKRPGYTVLDKLEADREKVRDRKQLKGQEDIEKALFDYTVYPAALFHKDATVNAARKRDAILSKNDELQGPKTIKSLYYDVTITKPRDPVPSWCQNIARRGLCALFADYMRESHDETCWEACGMKRDFTKVGESEDENESKE